MAEIYKYSSGLPAFSEVLDIISCWSQRENLSEKERGHARSELESCLKALEEKTDGMSGMVRGRVSGLLNQLCVSDEDEQEVAE